ncbi:COBRA-like protein [Parasponia andersonii]|uniref:COBRA-like protein n=1 Tax=Parasponia andersonii TaxID=3476 RepID=A0A2P5CK76_PARAD|nr:COBRA-like protein [Parasponia andersonii]
MDFYHEYCKALSLSFYTGTSSMYVCCKPDPKYKAKKAKRTKFLPRQNGDLSFTYDILQAFGGSYLAQVTIENEHPLGRLDHWNLTWEWTRGEFINAMRGAYTHKRDSAQCIYGAAGEYYKDLDFSQVMNCEKRPVIADLPRDRAQDEKVGKLPYCCRNGSLLPPLMDQSRAKAVFQLQVFKIPPDVNNRTALYPPQKWHIDGVLNPEYKCGAPIRVDPTEFPDPSGLQSVTDAIASWQVVCNITRPKVKQSRCCVSFSAYYNDSVIPCNTCACGCTDTDEDAGTCDQDSPALLLPAEALLVPFANRSEKARAWARLKHREVPKRLPCSDNCGVSLNWHINSDYRSGWTARITLFNWRSDPFEDWFAAVQMKKAYPGYENVYSFNGTRLPLNDTVFFQGLPGLNYLIGETNGSNPKTDPRVPGKQQSVISFSKKNTPGINIRHGDGFPTKVFFNGEECEIPRSFPVGSGGHKAGGNGFLPVLLACVLTFVLMVDRGFH